MNNTLNIQAVENFLQETPTFYLATVRDGKPKCRPIGFHLYQNEKIYFGVGTFKDVYKQLEKNPYAEICACKSGKFLRYFGKAVFEEDDTITEAVFKKSPGLKKIYNESTGHKLGIFHLEEATAEFHAMSKLESSYSL